MFLLSSSMFVVSSFLCFNLISSFKFCRQIVFFVLNPALVCINLANTVTFESVVLLWVTLFMEFFFSFSLFFPFLCARGGLMFSILFSLFMLVLLLWMQVVHAIQHPYNFCDWLSTWMVACQINQSSSTSQGSCVGLLCCWYLSLRNFVWLWYRWKWRIENVFGSIRAGNLGNLPLIIVPAVCREKGSPFGAPDVCHTYGMAYASLSMAVRSFVCFIWHLWIIPTYNWYQYIHVFVCPLSTLIWWLYCLTKTTNYLSVYCRLELFTYGLMFTTLCGFPPSGQQKLST